jgi:D-inositol-3-phosphate glycosyltransferase
MHVALVMERVGGAAGGGGGSRLMLDLGLELQSLDHEVTIVTHNFEPETDYNDAAQRIPLRSVRTGPFQVRDGARAALRRVWRDMPRVAELVPGDVDVINAHEWPALRAARLAADRLDVPFVWTRHDHTIYERAVLAGQRTGVHGHRLLRLPRALVALPDLLDARRAAAIVVLDDLSAEMVRRAYRRPARVLRSGPSDQFFHPPDREAARRRLGIAPDVFLALGVGILYPQRRFEDVVRAIGLVSDPSIHAYIIGSDHIDPAYADTLTELIRAGGLGARVTLPRRPASEAELRDAYAAADVFVFPNDERQSWGLAPLEAIAAGTPVIVSAGAGVAEVLDERPGVRTVAARQPAAIAAALRASRNDASSTDVDATRRWLESELSIRRYAERMVEIFAAARANGSPFA